MNICAHMVVCGCMYVGVQLLLWDGMSTSLLSLQQFSQGTGSYIQDVAESLLNGLTSGRHKTFKSKLQKEGEGVVAEKENARGPGREGERKSSLKDQSEGNQFGPPSTASTLPSVVGEERSTLSSGGVFQRYVWHCKCVHLYTPHCTEHMCRTVQNTCIALYRTHVSHCTEHMHRTVQNTCRTVQNMRHTVQNTCITLYRTHVTLYRTHASHCTEHMSHCTEHMHHTVQNTCHTVQNTCITLYRTHLTRAHDP